MAAASSVLIGRQRKFYLSVMMKRLVIFLLAAALALGSGAPVAPHAVAAPEAAAALHDHAMPASAAHHAGGAHAANSHRPDTGAPCEGAPLACPDRVCCATALALPGALVGARLAVQWSAIIFPMATSLLDGLTLEPELFPPIALA
jgi:hypothetical protein